MLSSLSPANMFSSALELNEFMRRLPDRLNTLADQLVDGIFDRSRTGSAQPPVTRRAASIARALISSYPSISPPSISTRPSQIVVCTHWPFAA